MSPAGGLVVLVNTEMEFDPSIPEPGSTPVFQRGRFGQLFASENVPVEHPRRRFGSGWNGDLYVMEEPGHEGSVPAERAR